MSSVSFSLPQPGMWTVRGEFAGQIVTQQVEITDKNSTTPITLTFSFATITVTSPVGTSLLLTDGTNQLTAVSTGTNVFTIYNMGQWTVSGTLEGYTLNSVSVTVQPDQNYPVQLSIQTATLTVTAPVGTVVTVVGGGDTQQETATTGTAVFNLTQLGTYTVSGTLNGLVSSTETVQVTAFQPYSVTLTIQSATIIVYTIPDTLVTIQNSGAILSATADGSGEATFAVQAFGVWSVSGVQEGYTFTPTSVDVQAYQQYGVNLDPLVATITVTAPAGTEVLAENSTGQQVQGYAAEGTAVLEIYSFGTWTISGTQNGLVTNTVPVEVADWTDYPVTLTIWAATITATTPTGTLVTAQNGLNQIQATAVNDQVIFAVQETGDWLVSAQFDTQSDSETVNVQAEQDYPIRLWVPTIVPTVVTGSVVTCTQGDTVLTKTSQSGKVKFYVPALGEWTVHATLNTQSSNTVIVDVQEDRDYPMLLDYEFATITVATVAGTEVTAQNGAIIITQTADSNGEAVFEVATTGTWTLSADFDGELVTAEVVVSDTINYDVELRPPGQISYYGYIQSPEYNMSGAAGVSFNGLALFAGGQSPSNSNYGTSSVSAYTNTLILQNITQLSFSSRNPTGASSSLYAMFGGGVNSSGTPYKPISATSAYNESLTRVQSPSLSIARFSMEAASVSGYILFAGGNKSTSSSSVFSNVVDCYNEELVLTQASNLGVATSPSFGVSAFGKAVFGGQKSDTLSLFIYDEQLTQTEVSLTFSASHGWRCEKAGEYAVLAADDYAYFIDQSNVLQPAQALSVARDNCVTTSLGTNAIFFGGFPTSGGYSLVTDVYNSHLTRTTSDDLPASVNGFSAASAYPYAIIGRSYKGYLNYAIAYVKQ